MKLDLKDVLHSFVRSQCFRVESFPVYVDPLDVLWGTFLPIYVIAFLFWVKLQSELAHAVKVFICSGFLSTSFLRLALQLHAQYAHRKCVQRWCNEKGDTICEICRKVGITFTHLGSMRSFSMLSSSIHCLNGCGGSTCFTNPLFVIGSLMRVDILLPHHQFGQIAFQSTSGTPIYFGIYCMLVAIWLPGFFSWVLLSLFIHLVLLFSTEIAGRLQVVIGLICTSRESSQWLQSISFQRLSTKHIQGQMKEVLSAFDLWPSLYVSLP